MTFWGIVVLCLLLSAAVALGVARILGAFSRTPDPADDGQEISIIRNERNLDKTEKFTLRKYRQ